MGIVFSLSKKSGAMKILIRGLYFIYLLGSSDAAVAIGGPCPPQDKGMVKTRQYFECSPEEPHYAFCSGEKETCNCNGDWSSLADLVSMIPGAGFVRLVQVDGTA